MKKLFCLLGVFICCIFCSFPVQADIIWEPDDDFYYDHTSECTYINRMYTANGPDGIVIVYKSPESPKVITRLENGENIYISYTYEDSDGIIWGIHEDYNHKKTGWMPMDYMNVVYDSISFAEEFETDIVTQDGVLDDAYLGKDIYLWKYPGAEECYPMGPNEIGTNEYLPSYSKVFVDEEGRSWGNVGYYFGMKNVWVCIEQPTADFDMLYPDGAPQRGTVQSDIEEITTPDPEQAASDTNQTKRIVPKQNSMIIVITVILVLAVVLVTAGLLIILRRKPYYTGGQKD